MRSAVFLPLVVILNPRSKVVVAVAGYLVWSQRVPTVPLAIAYVERLFKRSIGPDGRSVLFDLPDVPENARE